MSTDEQPSLEPERKMANRVVSEIVERVCSPERAEERALLKQRHLRLRFYEHYFRLLYGSSMVPADVMMNENEWTFRSRSLDRQMRSLEFNLGQRWSSWSFGSPADFFLWQAMSTKKRPDGMPAFFPSTQMPDGQRPPMEAIEWAEEPTDELDDADQWILRDKTQTPDRKERAWKQASGKKRPAYPPLPMNKRWTNRQSGDPRPQSNRADEKEASRVPRKPPLPPAARRIQKTKKERQLDEEIENDRRNIQQFVEQKRSEPEREDEDDDQTDGSWRSPKRSDESSEEERKNEEDVNFDRSWSSWTLKKAEVLGFDADVDDQPVGPLSQTIRQKFFKSALIKESDEIAKRRRARIENKPIVAKIRGEMLRKEPPLPRPPPKKSTARMKLAVRKTASNDTASAPADGPKETVSAPADAQDEVPEAALSDHSAAEQEAKEEVDEKPADEKRPSELSLFGQLKKALNAVPSKIKEALHLGGKERLERTKSTEEVAVDRPSGKKRTNRRSSSVDQPGGRRIADKKQKKSPNLLHEHNADVRIRLGGVLTKKPKEASSPSNRLSPAAHRLLKSPTLPEGRRPISWRTDEEIHRLAERSGGEQKAAKKKEDLHLPSIPAGDRPTSSAQSTEQTEGVKLPEVTNPTLIIDFDRNPYRSAGRTYSPALAWPVARSFNPEIGRCKIIDYIEQNWPYQKDRLNYSVEHRHAHRYGEKMQRFKYQVRFTSEKTKQEGFVYFNVDVSRIDLNHPIELSYRFQGQSTTHRTTFSPTSIPFRKRWLKALEQGLPLPT